MTDPYDDETRPISVAELLARNGTIGAPPVGGRRRRKRGKSDNVTVAELTGEIPIITEDVRGGRTAKNGTASHVPDRIADDYAAEDAADDYGVDLSADYPAEFDTGEMPGIDTGEMPDIDTDPDFDAPGFADFDTDFDTDFDDATAPTVDDSVHDFDEPDHRTGMADLRDPHPVDVAHDVPAEDMWPDPVDDDVDDAAAAVVAESRAGGTEPSSYLTETRDSVHGGYPGSDRRNVRELSVDEQEVEEALTPDPFAAESAAHIADADADFEAGNRGDVDARAEAGEEREDGEHPSAVRQVMRAGLIVFQSILAVAFGGGLFLAFNELWKWNNIVALVLSVLVILGLVVSVRIVRKTEDIASTLIAVAVGAMVTLGPLALLQSH